MITPAEPLLIPNKVVAEIELLSRVAQANGSLVALQDIVALTHINLTEEQIKAQWPDVPDLAARFELKDGFVHDRVTRDGINLAASLEKETERRRRAQNYMISARAFTPFFEGKEAELVAISGSTSYQSASETDDLDFFCITKPDFLWPFLAKSMLLSRVLRLFRRNTPKICFSYAVDTEHAEKEFASSNDPLFARDALTTVVVHGTAFYQRLLNKSSWMSDYYPQLFKQRTMAPNESKGLESPSTVSTSRKFLNQILYFVVGKYIAIKSAMLNRKFRKLGKSASLFRLRIGHDHLILESVRYSQLRAMYTTLSDKVSQTGTVNPVQTVG